MSELRTYVQWKGTQVCMDLYCECGHHSHVDAWFAYHVRCPDCGAVYRMPENLPLERVEPGDDDLVAMDTSEPIVTDGVEVGGIGGNDDGRPWRELRQVPSYAAAREAEQS